MSCFGVLLFVLDSFQSESSLPFHSHVCLELVLSIPDFAHIGVPLLLQSFTRTDSAALPFSLACPGLVFSPSVLDSTHCKLTPPPRSFACIELALPVSDLTHLGSLVPLRVFGQMSLASSIFGCHRFEVLLLMPAFAELGSSLVSQSSARFDLSSSVPNSLHLDLTPSSRSVCCMSSMFTMSRLPQMEASLLTIDMVSFRSPPFSRVTTRPDAVLPSLNYPHMGSLIVSRSLSCSGSIMAVLDHLHLELLPAIRSVVHLTLAMFVLDSAVLGAATTVQSFA